MHNRNILPIRSQVNQISDAIKKRRKLLRITQYDLAELSGISSRYLQDIENGKANPSLITLLTILNVLGLTLQIDIVKID